MCVFNYALAFVFSNNNIDARHVRLPTAWLSISYQVFFFFSFQLFRWGEAREEVDIRLTDAHRSSNLAHHLMVEETACGPIVRLILRFFYSFAFCHNS